MGAYCAGMECFRYVVIGVGGIGSAATYWLAARAGGEHVLGLERFELDHVRGASRDTGRIIRYFYHRPEYVRMAPNGFAAWADVEQASGVRLIHLTGGVTLHPAGTVVPADDYLTALAECDVPVESLDGAQVRRRWPQLQVPDDCVGVVQDDTGVVRADLANDTHVALARSLGATVRDRTRVREIVPVAGGYEVRTDDGVIACERVVVAADAWTNDLLGPLGTPINLTVTREQVTYYDAGPSFAEGTFPVWAWLDAESFYGIPSFAEVPAKAAMDSGGPVVDPETRTFEHDEAYQARLDRFLSGVIPGLASGRRVSTKTCLYAMPPDRDFVIDRLPEHPGIVVCQGAAHAFKFASLIGRVAADLSLDRDPEVDISLFTMRRPVLSDPDARVELLLRRPD